MFHSFSAYRTFFREFQRQYRTTGAVCPSGRALSKALTRFVRQGKNGAPAPRRILEVGPGSGAVTELIVSNLNPHDRLDLVEINDSFVVFLRQRLEGEPLLRAAAGQIQIFHRPVEQMVDQPPYDLIVSGLPLNNFSAAEVERILNVLAVLLKPGGRLSFFEYIAIRKMRALVSGQADRQRLRSIGQLLTAALSKGEVAREAVWLNVPPAWVHHVDLHREAAVAATE
jgi:phospholipid N-methyltransferase